MRGEFNGLQRKILDEKIIALVEVVVVQL